MPQTSAKLFTPSEVAQIIGVDGKQLQLWAHKGLTNPTFSIDNTSRFTELDCARLKIIKRADHLGYSPEKIFDLIGNPDEVLEAKSPVSACKHFAMEKYKQVYDELSNCEPLEQITKQSDLQLLKNYIKHLKEIERKILQKEPQQKGRTSINPSPAGQNPQASPFASTQTSSSSPRTLQYSVAKLWDDAKKVAQLQKEKIYSLIKRDAVSQHSKISFLNSIMVKGVIAGVILGALIGYFFLIGDSDEPQQSHIAANNLESPATGNIEAPNQKAVVDPPLRVSEEQHITGSRKLKERQVVGQSPDGDPQGSLDSTKDAPGKAVDKRPSEVAEEFDPQPTSMPDQKKTNPKKIAKSPQIKKPETRPIQDNAVASDRDRQLPVDAEPNAGTQIQLPSDTDATSNREVQSPIALNNQSLSEKVQPITNFQKTDHPEAVEWEQKSYEAAVQGDFDRAIADATKAIDLDPGRVNPYINRSWAYLEKNMLALAIQDCKTALLIDPKNAFAYNNRGLAYQRKANIALAQDNYRRACELGLELGCQNLNDATNQSRISGLINQSQIFFKAKDWDGVIRSTTEVINLDRQNSVAYTNRSAAYTQKNLLNKALEDGNEAIRHSPDFPLAYNNRGYVFELLGNNKKAAFDYLKSCSLGLDLGCNNFERLNQGQ